MNFVYVFKRKTSELSCILFDECQLRWQAPTQAESFTVGEKSQERELSRPFSSHLRACAPDATA